MEIKIKNDAKTTELERTIPFFIYVFDYDNCAGNNDKEIKHLVYQIIMTLSIIDFRQQYNTRIIFRFTYILLFYIKIT